MIMSAEFADTENASPMADASRVLLLNRYEIDPTSPLPAFTRASARAFAAIDRNEPSRPIYAVVTDPKLPYRQRSYHQARQIQSDAFTTLIRSGSEMWPLTQRKETILIVPRPVGTPLMESLTRRFEPMPFHRLTRNVLPTIANMLEELANYHIAHRVIRPDNIFINADTDQINVGECFSVPGGVALPAVFEPLERAMCLPEGRGEGDPSDDMFALGVTVLFLVLGQNPVADLDHETLMLRRRQLGTYAALVGKRRVPTELIQMLRALLRDEPADRWTVEDLLGWLNNGRTSSPPVTVKAECTKPFEFGDRKHKTAATLAYALGGDWPGALEAVKSGKIDKWLDKALKDKRAQAALVRCNVSGTNGPRSIGEDLLVARTLLALDPNGPLRYRDIAVMPDGIGPALAKLYDDPARLKTLLDMLNGMLPAFWMDQKNRPNYAMFAADEALNRVMPLLAQQVAGFGVERVLYELNPSMACQSPLVSADNCTEITPLLRALDRSAGEQDAILDRHIAGFIAARVSGSVDRDLNDISLARTPGDKLLAQLRLMTYVESKSEADNLAGICGFFARKSGAILDTYRNVELRARLARQANAAAESGDIGRMLKVLGSQKTRRWDTNGFNAARLQYRQDERDAAALQDSFATIPERSRSSGKQLGVLCAGVISLATTAVVLMTQMS
jgi:hypothetical protein